MSPYKVSVFQFDEITNCTIVCACGTEVTVALDSMKWGVPKGCPAPTCSKSFAALNEIIVRLNEAYSLAKEAKKLTEIKVEFHVKELSDKAVSRAA
jgi:hypothetical protein